MGMLALNSLEIQNFRGFHHLKIERLGRVNLIVGKNNVGKTSLLGAVAEQAVRDIVEPYRYFPISHTIKAHLHTWLAWQKEPGTPIGLAITKRYFNADAEHAQRLMTWVRQLFEING